MENKRSSFYLSGEFIPYQMPNDFRFSKNKEPYKTHFGAFIAKGGRKSPYAGYYIHFEPDNSFVGGGIYQPEPKLLKSIRTQIFKDVETYKDIINNAEFKKYFPEIFGEKLKTAPRGFPKDFADIDLLNNKHYAVSYGVNNSFWFNKNLIENISDIFDFKKYILPKVVSTIDEEFIIQAKEKFNESIENLKKDKTIKSTLELVVYSKSDELNKLTSTEAEDLFVVSKNVFI